MPDTNDVQNPLLESDPYRAYTTQLQVTISTKKSLKNNYETERKRKINSKDKYEKKISTIRNRNYAGAWILTKISSVKTN